MEGKDGDGRPTESRPRRGDFTFFFFTRSLAWISFAHGQTTITILRVYAQEVDAVGQGRYPVLIGAADFVAINRAKQGVSIAIVDARQLKEGTDLSPTNGNLALFNRAPNPNAAKIYINSLFQKKGKPSLLAPMVMSARDWMCRRTTRSPGECRRRERSRPTRRRPCK